MTAKERNAYDKGLVAVLKSFHADLDAAVLDAYGWNDNPSDEQLLERLVALNSERRAEEAAGHTRWLRPDFQAPPATISLPFKGRAGEGMGSETALEEPHPPSNSPLEGGRVTARPASLPEQIAALANALNTSPQSETDLATRFTGKGKWKTRLPELLATLATLATLGRARQLEDGRWLG